MGTKNPELGKAEDLLRMHRRGGSKRFLSPGRQAFTLLETMIALALATIIIMVLFNTMIAGQKTVTHGVETLEYLGKATILLEYIKRDIRSASSEDSSITCGGGDCTIRVTNKDGKSEVVKYSFKKATHHVVREAEGKRAKKFGLLGNAGIIENFLVKPVDDDRYRGFYQVEVAFSPRRRRLSKKAPAARPIHKFRILANRRAPDARDDRWNRAFDDR